MWNLFDNPLSSTEMKTERQFVAVPKELLPVLGSPLKGTRKFRKKGSEDQLAAWSDVVFQAIGHCVSPTGAAMRVGVSHAAVHDRIKRGKLTGFFYYSTKGRRRIFSGKQPKRLSEIGLIPVSECAAWRKELEERAIEKGVVTRDQLEGGRPDWEWAFLEWKSKFAKERQEERRGCGMGLNKETHPAGSLCDGAFHPEHPSVDVVKHVAGDFIPRG